MVFNIIERPVHTYRHPDKSSFLFFIGSIRSFLRCLFDWIKLGNSSTVLLATNSRCRIYATENAVKEYHKERLRLNPEGGPVTEIENCLIMRNMNQRIRDRGMAAKEILNPI